MEIPLNDIPNGDPILSGALHADIFAVVVEQPLLESDKAAVEGRESFLMVMGNDAIACDDRSDEKGFVNIDATADGVSEFHTAPPSKFKGEAVTAPPHKNTEVFYNSYCADSNDPLICA